MRVNGEKKKKKKRADVCGRLPEKNEVKRGIMVDVGRGTFLSRSVI